MPVLSPSAVDRLANVADDMTDAPVLATALALLDSVGALLDDGEAPTQISACLAALTDALPALRLAWAWWGVDDGQAIRPHWVAGALATPLGDQAWACEKASAALQRALAGEAVTLDRTALHTLGPWGSAALDHGLRSALLLPLRAAADGRRGVLALHADVDGWFQRRDAALWPALAGLLARRLHRAAPRPLTSAPASQTAPHWPLDEDTGLPARTALPALAAWLQTLPGGAAAVLMLALDHPELLQQRHGDAALQAMVKTTAAALGGALRHSDLCLRWGDAQFLLLLPGTAAAQAQPLAEGLRRRLKTQPHTLADGSARQVSVSIGVAAVSAQASEASLASAVASAEAALHAARRGGRDRVVVG